MVRSLRRPSPALVVALIALFVSLGGVSYGVATGSIDSREIRNNTVRSKDIRNSNVLTRDIRNSTIRGRDVGRNTLTGADINESKLGLIPDALHAGAADVAARAANVNTVRVLGRVTAAPGQTKPVAREGPLTLQLRCVSGGVGSVGFFLEIDTSANNAAVDSQLTGEEDADFDANDSPVVVVSETADTGVQFEQANWTALTPGGKQFQGYGMAASRFGGSNNCITQVVLLG